VCLQLPHITAVPVSDFPKETRATRSAFAAGLLCSVLLYGRASATHDNGRCGQLGIGHLEQSDCWDHCSPVHAPRWQRPCLKTALREWKHVLGDQRCTSAAIHVRGLTCNDIKQGRCQVGGGIQCIVKAHSSLLLAVLVKHQPAGRGRYVPTGGVLMV